MTAHSTPRLLRAITPALLALTPAHELIVVHGWRDGEENALRIAGALTRRAAENARIVFLCEEPPQAREQLAIALRHAEWNPERIQFVRKNSLLGYVDFLRARLVFMTHGLFGNPRPGKGRVHVLLGHGHGPKSGQDPADPLYFRAQLATTNNAVWGRAVIDAQFRDSPMAAAVTGNPRDDAFADPVDRDRIAALGLDPSSRFLLWLPTYRPGKASIAARLDESASARLKALRQHCAQHGIELVTKAHQLDDAANADEWGMKVITSDALRAAGLSFFQLLALSAGLVSDYSSVWVDYLRTGRPVGLLFPDFHRFEVDRGFNRPSIAEVAESAVLSDVDDVARFVAEVAQANGFAPRPSTLAIAERLGLVTAPGATERVIDVAADRLAAQGIDGVLHRAAHSTT